MYYMCTNEYIYHQEIKDKKRKRFKRDILTNFYESKLKTIIIEQLKINMRWKTTSMDYKLKLTPNSKHKPNQTLN